MRAVIAILSILAAQPVYSGSQCEISGDAKLWAYDACLWRYETDDTLQPRVIRCSEANLTLISRVGSCRAKRIFKERICTLARQWQLKDPDPLTCMSMDKPLGSSVRNGGI